MSKVRTRLPALVLLIGAVLCGNACTRFGFDSNPDSAGNTSDGATVADGSHEDDAADLGPIDGELPARPAFLAGVNLAGAEFGVEVPGTFGVDYTYPTPQEVDYFLNKGMNVFRLPFRWERLQLDLLGALDSDELSRIDDFISYATGKGARVVLDLHNEARFYDQIVGQGVTKEAFADLWSRLAGYFKSNPLVIFGLMSAPHDMPTELWRDDANVAIQAIRATGATNLILVPGNGWTRARLWDQSGYGTPNSEVMLTIVDPGDNYAFEVHQFLDVDGSGTSASCVSAQVGVERLQPFTTWLEQNGERGFLAAFGGSSESACLQALDNMLTHIDASQQRWMGWTYWAAGPWWSADYPLSIEPQNGADAPQMAVLGKHLPR